MNPEQLAVGSSFLFTIQRWEVRDFSSEYGRCDVCWWLFITFWLRKLIPWLPVETFKQRVLMISLTRTIQSFNRKVYDKFLVTKSRLVACVQPAHLLVWLNAAVMFILRRHISFSLILPSVFRFFVCLVFVSPIHFVSVAVCQSLSSLLTSVQIHIWEKKTKCSPTISLRLLGWLWAGMAHSENSEAEKQN